MRMMLAALGMPLTKTVVKVEPGVAGLLGDLLREHGNLVPESVVSRGPRGTQESARQKDGESAAGAPPPE